PPRLFAGDLDAADTEFQEAVIEFSNGTKNNLHETQTAHFATTIRSSVLAIQINRWIKDFPDAYQEWRTGHSFDGPTFLQDENAAQEASEAWMAIDRLIKDAR